MEEKQENSNSWWDGEAAPKETFKEAPKETPQQFSKKSKIVIISGISLLILIVIITVVAIVVTKNRNSETTGTAETTENSETTETIAGSGEQIISAALSSGSATATIGGKSVTYNAAYLVDGIDVTISGGTFESATDDQVTFLVINGGSLKINGDVLINKTGSADFSGRGDNYSFYGTNSAITVVGAGSSIEINGATITSNVSGANAVVATNGGEALVENVTITTQKDNSRGLHATYGGSINADNTTISTKGGSCASLATDRGSGTVVADNMTLNTAGAGSPLIYSTGDITVTNSKGTATGAQIAVVEGKNSINIQGCDFSTNGIGNRNNVDNAAVMIYQSMSGDASVGTGSFTATDSTLTVLKSSSQYENVPFFFITNTDATINLTSVTANFSSAQKFIVAKGTSEWGRSGSNGGKVTITTTNLAATNTETEVDNISSVTGL